MAQAYRSASVVTPEGSRPGALLVEEGVIRGICNDAELPPGATLVECGADALLPGLVDAHVHINEPGRTEWEGFATATRAAAAGGYTLLLDMPLNCLPETTTVEALEAKRTAAAGKCWVDWAPWGGCVNGNGTHLRPLAEAGVPGFKCFLIDPGCDGFTQIDAAELERALPTLAELGLPLLVHAELAGPIDAARAALEGADWRRYATYLASRPDEAELAAIRLLLRLCRMYRFPLHIVHLSTAMALPELRAARAEGLPLTVETCPHYLAFAAEEIVEGDTLKKCAPPVRGQANRELLWEALAEGTIDLVATDHSPCPPAMKGTREGRFDQAWGGIASLSVALPVMHTEARRRGFTLDDLSRWMCAGPARLAGMERCAGALMPGREANFVRFAPDEEWTVRAEDLHFRHPVSPYVGARVRGRVKATYLRGDLVWGEGGLSGVPRGRERTVC